MKKKWSLVLGGGGAKGAYQLGVWQTLRELRIKFECVIGTSVGALNGALMVQGAYNEAFDMWHNINLNTVVNVPKELYVNGKLSINKNNLSTLKKVQRDIIKNGGIDTTPLKQTLQSLINEKRIRSSKIDFGIVTYQLNNLKPIEIFKKDIKDGMLIDYLMASSTLPGFKFTEIDNKLFFDGGLHDNVPFKFAKESGYNRIITIDISGLGVNRKPDVENCYSIYIKNSIDIGNILDFDREVARKNILLGYLDSQKVFNKVSGIDYFYKNETKIINELNKILFDRQTQRLISSYLEQNQEYCFETLLRDTLPKNMAKHKNLVMTLCESSAKLFNIDLVKLYDFKGFLGIIYDKFRDLEVVKNSGNSEIDLKGFLDKTKNVNFLDIFNKKTRYNMVLNFLLDDNYLYYIKNLNSFFDNLLIPSKIFYIILKKYFI